MLASCLTLVGTLAVISLQGAYAKEYVVELDKFEAVTEYGTEWVDWKTMAMQKVDRNKFVIKGDFSLKMNLGDNQKFMVQAYLNSDGKKRGPPMVTIVKNACKMMREYKDTYEGLAAASNLPKEPSCPLPKSDYHFDNYILDTSFLQNNTPPGEYLLVCTIMDGDKSVAAYQLYFTVELE